jgi:hypothetical protein
MNKIPARIIAFIGFALFFSSISAWAGELWKGHTTVRPLEVGLLSGFAIYGDQANWGILPAVATLIKEKGFVEDLDNRVWVEGQLGPTFFSNQGVSKTGMQYSAHLRWDFTMNEVWTFYALGGFSGFFLPNIYSSGFTLHPRFGAGAIYQTKTALMLRGEVSAEFIGAGVALQF